MTTHRKFWAITSLLAVPILALTLIASAINAPNSRTPTLTSAVSTPGAPLIDLIGDSITAGGYLAAPWRDDYVARAQDIVCGYGCSAVHGIGTGGQCLIAAGCGCAVAGCANPLPTMFSQFTSEVLDANPKPTVVVLEAGLNDDMNVSEYWFENAYSTIAALCAANGIRFIASTITPIAAFRGYYNPWRVDVNTWLRATFPAQDLLDFAAVLQQPNGYLDPMYDSGDGIHPNALGTVRMADMFPGAGLAPLAVS